MTVSQKRILLGVGAIALAFLLVGWFFAYPMSFGTKNESLSQEDSQSFGSSAGMVAPAPSAPRVMGEAPQAERLIIKTGSVSLVVTDVAGSVASIHQFATSQGGFVVSSNISKDALAPYAEVTIRIPSEIFDAGVQEVKKMGEVKNESVNGQDVTEEYVDLNGQLKNLRATETQFLKIMEKAVKIEDVLSVQRELSRIQGEIEVLQGRMKYLEQSAKLSTLTVYLSPNPENLPVVNGEEKWKPVAVFKDAVRSLLDMGKGIVNAIIWVAVYLPVWIVIGGLVWIIRRQWKKMQIKK